MQNFRQSRYSVYNTKDTVVDPSNRVDQVFSSKNIKALSSEISRRLIGARSDGRGTTVPDETISSVLDGIYYKSNRDLPSVYEEVIQHIVEEVEMEYSKEYLAQRYDVNVQSYNPVFGLKQQPQIKLKTIKPQANSEFDTIEPRF